MDDLADAPAPPADLSADAAVMVMLLGDDEAAAVLSRLAPDELGRLGARMGELGAIGPEAIAAAVVGFVERIEAQGPLSGDDQMNRFRHKVTRAVGAVRADNLMRRIAPAAGPGSSIEIIRWLLPDAIVPLIEGEHPQAIAVLLVQLEAEAAAASAARDARGAAVRDRAPRGNAGRGQRRCHRDAR